MRFVPFTATLLAVGALLPVRPLTGEPPRPGHHDRVNVTAPTRLDWSFAIVTRSVSSPPVDWLPDYDAHRVQYELFVPTRADRSRALPVILFLSPANEPMGWKQLQGICTQQQFLFASPYGAGNNCPPKKRVRIVLDVLDDLRRHHSIDPERTYLAGFSGGARITCAIAFALPEYFGGVLAVGGAHELRHEPWLRQRAIDRLSVALLTGEKDFNRGELERWRGPFLKEVGVRTRVWVEPGLGHDIPPARTVQEAVRWLEAGLGQRRDLARRYPASHAPGSQEPDREASSRALFAEAKKRLEQRETLYSGLMQMQGCMQRWPDLEVGSEARKILLEYEERSPHSWEVDDLAEQRRFLVAEARSLDAYVSGDLPAQYANLRPQMVRKALELWQQVEADNPGSALGQQAHKRIASLERLLADSSR